MATDPYEILGVKRDASQDDIQKSYRRLAKKLHPDLNPGNKDAETQFKDVAAAYDLLRDAEKRARFDRGEIDASGNERQARRYYRDFADAGANGAGHGYANDAGFADIFEGADVFSEMFARRGGNVRMRGADVRYSLAIDFLDAVNGATKRLTLPDGAVLDVAIPPGTEDGQILRLRGKGREGRNGPPGDALIGIAVSQHPLFTRKGDDIHLDLPISLTEAVLGGRIAVPTPTGSVAMKVPKGANSGTVLRLKGKGVQRADGKSGDEYVNLKIVLPDLSDPELESFVTGWGAGKTHDPRKGMES